MITEKKTLKTTLTYSEDMRRCYAVTIEWEKEKPKAAVIMLSAGKTDGVCFDKTTGCVIKNLVALGYGSVDILNLFSSLDGTKEDTGDEENLEIIGILAKLAKTVVFAVGTGHKTNKKVQARQKEVIEILKMYDEKLYCISDETGEKFYHPLCPKVYRWNLVQVNSKRLCEDD